MKERVVEKALASRRSLQRVIVEHVLDQFYRIFTGVLNYGLQALGEVLRKLEAKLGRQFVSFWPLNL